MPVPLFVLTLDVDETLINGKSVTPHEMFDFNGSDKLNDMSAWVELIEQVKALCFEKGYQLIVKLVSAKNDAKVDDTIDACQRYLSDYLLSRTRQGRPFNITERTKYPIRKHYMGNSFDRSLFNILMPCNKAKSLAEHVFDFKDVMPAIHLCFNNQVVEQGCYLTSKALVLENIRNFYGVSPDQMIHLDNARWVDADLKSGLNGQTLSFNNFVCHELELLATASKELRTLATRQVIIKFKNKIVSQIKSLPCLLEANKLEDTCISHSLTASEDSHPFNSEILPESVKEDMLLMLNNLLYAQEGSLGFMSHCFRFFMPFCQSKVTPHNDLPPGFYFEKQLGKLHAYLQREELLYIDVVIKEIEQVESETYLASELKEYLCECRQLMNRPMEEKQAVYRR